MSSYAEPFQDFVVGITDTYNHQYIFSINSYIVKSHGNPYTHTVKHNLTPPMLQIIKSIFNGTGLHTLHWAEPTHVIFKKMIDNPKYFMTNCTEFEETCRKEYELIKEQKQELDKLRIGLAHKETILEKKEIGIIIEKSSMMAERTKLMEEKRHLFMVKQKLDLMKRELDNERDAFEKEKKEHEIKNIDLDDYFELPIAEIVGPTIAESILFTSQPFADL